jgi:hypothetical protein
VVFVVLWHPAAQAERDAIDDPGEWQAISHVNEKLEQIGRLPYPHSSAVQGKEGKGLRELRPRGGHSRWRPIYRQVNTSTFVILAVGPEAEIDQSGFDQAVRNAQLRLSQLDDP